MRPSSSGRPGRWFLGLLMPMLYPASGCTPSSTILMAPSLATRRVSWPVAFLKPMVLTIMRPSRLWRASAPSVSSSPSLWISPGRFISWTCPMPFFTVTSMRRYLWSNRLGTLLRGSLLRCVSSRRLSMGWSKARVRGSSSSHSCSSCMGRFRLYINERESFTRSV